MTPKNCGECKKYMSTATEGHGVCSTNTGFFPVKASDTCHFVPPESLCCRDCSRFGEDFACMTAAPDDSIYEDDERCGGFIDKSMDTIQQELFHLYLKYDGDKEATKKAAADMIDQCRLPWE